jgi:hypothetical protein
LNVYCAFGISLKACLLQCLLHFMPLTCSTFVGFRQLCVFVRQGVSALDAFNAWVIALSTDNLKIIFA